jgi:hypothetical protein
MWVGNMVSKLKGRPITQWSRLLGAEEGIWT